MAGNTQGGSLVYVDEASVKKLQAVARTIKTSGQSKALTKALNAEIRQAAKPLLDDLKKAALEIQFKDGGQGESKRGKRTGRTLKSGKFKAGRGLRQEMAFGLRTQISKGQNTAGVRIRMASKDADVNRLGKIINAKGKIRHPLFGDKKHWYETQTSGRNWFYGTAQHQLPLVRKRIERVLDKYVADLAAKVDKAA